MKESFDFKKEWPRIKQQLTELSGEALELAKKGEEELTRFSRQSKIYVDITTLNLKQEHLYRQIGKEYVKARCPGLQPEKLKQLLTELAQVRKMERALKQQMKATKVRKPATRK